MILESRILTGTGIFMKVKKEKEKQQGARLQKGTEDRSFGFPGEADSLVHELQVHQIELEMQ